MSSRRFAKRPIVELRRAGTASGNSKGKAERKGETNILTTVRTIGKRQALERESGAFTENGRETCSD